jgi:hypothetical protein
MQHQIKYRGEPKKISRREKTRSDCHAAIWRDVHDNLGRGDALSKIKPSGSVMH